MFKKINLYKAFIYSSLISLALMIIIPISWVFMASLKTNAEFYGSPFNLPLSIQFDNFKNAFINAKMGEYFLNSILVTLMALIILLVVALPASYVLARFNFKAKKFINTFLMAGLFININYIVIPIFLMLLDSDRFIRKIFGFRFLLNNIFILALIYAASALPFTIYLLSSYFKTLSKSYEEAAYIDGYGYFKTMTKIMFPLAKPSIITVILFNFLAFWNEYIIALTLLSDPKGQKTLPIGLTNLYKVARGRSELGTLYAGLVIVMLPTLILYILVQSKLTKGMTVGGIKE